MEYEYRLVLKREGKSPTGKWPTRDLWAVHRKRTFLISDKTDLHYRCDHDAGVNQCLAPIEWVKIQRRQISEWEDTDPDPSTYVGTDVPSEI